jgi:hypothetical protein
MNNLKYRIAIVASLVVASALLLAVRPPGLNAVRPGEVRPAKTSVPRNITAVVSGAEEPDDRAAYRQAIEDVIPLMRSLHARGDTARLAQLARSVVEVWTELESSYPETVLDEDMRVVIEAWAGTGAPSRR